MNKRNCPYRARFGAVAGMFAAIALFNTAAAAADVSPDSLKLASGVVNAAKGYEEACNDIHRGQQHERPQRPLTLSPAK